jgi:DNA-directed RNA polymerase sigma subunit (sigma70/sigma32)
MTDEEGRIFELTALKGSITLGILQEDTQEVLYLLSTQEQWIIRYWFGLSDGHVKSRADVTGHFDISDTQLTELQEKLFMHIGDAHR